MRKAETGMKPPKKITNKMIVKKLESLKPETVTVYGSSKEALEHVKSLIRKKK